MTDFSRSARRGVPPRRLKRFGWIATLSVAAGCSGRPAAVRPVAIDSDDAAAAAMQAYDKNGDGALADDELAAVPALLAYKKLYDLDGSDSVSEDEIATRLDLWSDQGLGFRQLSVVVTLDGKPLGGANVEFSPESYLGENVKPATGVTGSDGVAQLSVAKSDLPPSLARLPIGGVTGGTFKVRVTHPTLKLPGKFNVETQYGEEIARDTIREHSFVELRTR